MNVLKEIEPREVMRYFEALCDLPHGSRNTKLISDYCAVFARVRGLNCRQDKSNNIIITKPASAGYENHPAVILQGHLDMVCEKADGCNIDFRRDGLTLKTDGDYIRADGTTLGADDGIAVAMLLALLDNKNIPHPPLEVVFTSDEEIGMLGAAALDTSCLRGKTMINIDSEEEGVLTVGCAGGAHSVVTLPLRRESVTGIPYTLQVTGLVGGHSGTEIRYNRTNAILFAARLFDKLSAGHDLRLNGFSGGGKDNAIPRGATVKFVSAAPLDEEANAMIAAALTELKETNPEAALTLTAGEPTSLGALTRECCDRVRAFFAKVPNGVQRMSAEMPDLVQTSLNLGIVSLEKSLSVTFSLRSSVNAERIELGKALKSIATELGGQYTEGGVYPAWEYRPQSRLRDVMQRVWREQNGGECRVEVIHAGLECGIFSDKIKGLDCVSFGPDIQDIHTPREALSISSVQRAWKYLLEVLKNL